MKAKHLDYYMNDLNEEINLKLNNIFNACFSTESDQLCR